MNTISLILACSGPGAGLAIQKSIMIGFVCAALGGIALLALAYDAARNRKMRFTLPVAVVLMLIHPAWTVSAIGGDCGLFKREASYVLTALFCGLLIYQFVFAKRIA